MPMFPRRIPGPTIAVAALAILLTHCGRSGPVHIVGKAMGTRYQVKLLRLPETESRSSLTQDIEVQLDRLEHQMSTYRPRSELTLFNRARSTDWIPVSLATVVVANTAKQIAIDTGGAFDPTVGPLVRLWHFGADAEGAFAVPSEDAIAAARANVGYRSFEVHHEPPRMRKSNPEISVDLSAVAKGYGVDRIAALLDDRRVENYFIEIGGEIRTKGTGPDGRKWRIGIEKPVASERDVLRVIEIDPAGDPVALATSGDYRNFHEVDGRRYGHTIDPRTGRPVEHGLRSVTVADDNCLRADGLATALMVLGPESGYTFAEKRAVAALFLTCADDGNWVERRTPEFVARFGPVPPDGATRSVP